MGRPAQPGVFPLPAGTRLSANGRSAPPRHLLKCSTHSCPDASFSTPKSLLRLPQRHPGSSSVSVTDCLEIASIQDLDPSGPGWNPGPARGPRPPGQARSPQGQLRGPPVCPMLSSGLRGWGGGRAQAGWQFTRFTGRQPPPGSSSPLETLHAGFSGAQDAWRVRLRKGLRQRKCDLAECLVSRDLLATAT